MKHIKKKFLLSHNIEKSGYEYLLSLFNKTTDEIISYESKNTVPHLVTSDKKFIQSFFYELNGTKIPIPEPNPIVIYFNNAQRFLKTIIEKRQKLFNELESQKYIVGEILNLMFDFYGCVVNFVSSLFDSLEAFINSKIPINFTIKNPDRRNKTMDKYKVIRYMSFENKLKIVLPKIYSGKSFIQEKSHLYEDIKKLLKLRNNITHAKSDINSKINYYDKLFTEALDFNYIKSIESAKSFINYYDKNLIEECDCGLDY